MRFHPPGFTLVEVIASLVLLGTLLVGILAAHRQHAKQIRMASLRSDAIKAADKLLNQCREKGLWGPATSYGRIEGTNNLSWKWSVSPSPELQRFGGAIGRLEILSTDHSAEPLAKVELITTAARNR